MSKPRDGFKKIRRVGKTRDEIACKNMSFFDLIDDSYDDDEDVDSEDDYDDEDYNF